MIEIRNKKIIKRIAWRYVKSSTQRNVFIILAIAISSFMMSSVFNLGIAFYDNTKVQQVIAEGTNRDIIIRNPEQEQLQLAKSLPQCKHAGIESRCSIATACNGNTINYGMVWKDTVNWEKQTKAAIGKVTGFYPKKENQIMASDWVLDKLGYEQYEIGMEIPIICLNNGNYHEKIFYLSGYYEDHSALMNPGSEHFLVSENFYNGIKEEYETPSTELMITLNHRVISKSQMQNLERDFRLNKEQGFYYNEELIYIARISLIGMTVLTLVIMLCAYLLIYNILYISFINEVQTYGLLKTLGTTEKQMTKILMYQAMLCLLVGAMSGIALGVFTAKMFIPWILGRTNTSISVATDIETEIFIIILTALFSAITVLISSSKPIRMVRKLAPLESLKYNPVNVNKHKKRGKHGGKIARMALYNITCNRKKSILVFASLFLSMTLFMSVNIYTNSINGKDYVDAYMPYDAILRNETRNDNGNQGEQILTPTDIEQLRMLEGVRTVEVITSDTITVEFDNDLFGGTYLKQFCDLWMDESYEEILKEIEDDSQSFYSCLVAVDDKQILELMDDSEFDLTAFTEGKTCILQTEIPLENSMGKKITFCPVVNNEEHTLQIAGTVEKNLSSYSGIAPNIYVSNRAIQNYVEDSWIERVNLVYEESYDKAADNRLNHWLEGKSLQISSKIKMMQNTDNSKIQSGMLGNGMAVLLAIIGLLNFVNVIITNICQKKQEYLLLNRIGMTEKQIGNMVMIEGLLYGGGTILAVTTLGTVISITAFNLLKEPYMKLHFPYVSMGIVMLILIVVCVVVPRIIYENK